ncbi:type II toxin-antitoxin system Phd/YefM family antitoxin [Pseudogemmobacter bohemicus]|uniref:type II toxin-antitoxin system Phd/YefM family antitoxin n=1 Tax=Pseudogemmobacter bohemicus TaxID=2250708 RepID=UPI000DD4BE67|nr:type II toxin-antitoxin system Phd/YefM family antitoxin [Pseudogemmobacter bohemicus]
MTQMIHAALAASITEFKRNPMAAMAQAAGASLVVLNHNEPAFYCVPPELYAQILDALEDLELNAIADERAGLKPVKVTLDDL